jgi:hypothetical protein
MELIGIQGEKYPLKPSLNLREQPFLGERWIKETYTMERFFNLTLSLIHPDLFFSGLQMLQKLRESEETKGIADKWQSVFSGINMIANRITQPHRDSKGRAEWYDLLANYVDEDGGATPQFLIQDIGVNLEYSSGTVVGFHGSIFKHEVRSWGAGDRVCLAHFMREAVRNRLDVPPAGWVEQSSYYQYLPDLL